MALTTVQCTVVHGRDRCRPIRIRHYFAPEAPPSGQNHDDVISSQQINASISAMARDRAKVTIDS